MRERPILFSPEMVRAILEGRKTQTRRVLKSSTEFEGPYNPAYVEAYKNHHGWEKICPYGKAGDKLWVKESWRVHKNYDGLNAGLIFIAMNGDFRGCIDYKVQQRAEDFWGRWRSSMFMPHWASRITLKITGVRVERLQDITEDDAEAEGVFGPPASQAGWRQYPFESCHLDTAKQSFKSLWDSINKEKHPWELNPYVWVLEFTRCENKQLASTRMDSAGKRPEGSAKGI